MTINMSTFASKVSSASFTVIEDAPSDDDMMVEDAPAPKKKKQGNSDPYSVREVKRYFASAFRFAIALEEKTLEEINDEVATIRSTGVPSASFFSTPSTSTVPQKRKRTEPLNKIVLHKPAMQVLMNMFKEFVVEYGKLRLLVKRANIGRLKLLLRTVPAGPSDNPKRLRRELEAAEASEKATVAALEKAGVKYPPLVN